MISQFKPSLASRKNQIISKSLPNSFSRSKTLAINVDTNKSDEKMEEEPAYPNKKFILKTNCYLFLFLGLTLKELF